MSVKNPSPMHPGRVLESVFMQEHDLNQSRLAEKLGCAPNKINEIVHGKRGITPEFAIQLEEIFSLDANVWVRMQGEYDVWLAKKTKGKKSKKRFTARSSNNPAIPRAASGSR